MNIADAIVDYLAPQWALKRQQARNAIRAYEAVKVSRIKDYARDDRSVNRVNQESIKEYRGIARDLEQNYDFASGALDMLTAKSIGANGIMIEPLPLTTSGDLDQDLAMQITDMLDNDWSLRPEVTRQYDWPSVQRLAFRSMIRDGEMFTQQFAGNVPALQHASEVPYSLEMIESNYCPLTYVDESKGIIQGIGFNRWGRPRNYYFYRNYPDGDYYQPVPVNVDAMRRVGANRIFHPKITTRINQARGMTRFASIISRISDTKKYENAEQVAHRVAASIGAQITSDSFELSPEESEARFDAFQMQPGMIWRATAGERFEIVESRRSGQLMVDFRDGMLRAAARGIGLGPSSFTGNYSTAYSAQRQELVEYDEIYNMMAAHFISFFVRPIYRNLIDTALIAGVIIPSRNTDLRTIQNASYQKPAMPWVDPQKEIAAAEKAVQAGFTSRSEVIRRRGSKPGQVQVQIAREQERDRQLGLQFSTSVSVESEPEPESNAELRVFRNAK